jgi:single-stranded-DNA-specific exonuclease
MNQQRRGSDQHTTREAAHDCRAAHPAKRPGHRALQTSWHQGVLGIIGSRCLDQYQNTVILTQRDDQDHQLGRSVAGFDVRGALEALFALLDQFGTTSAARRPHPERWKSVRQRLFRGSGGRHLTTEHLVRWPVEM